MLAPAPSAVSSDRNQPGIRGMTVAQSRTGSSSAGAPALLSRPRHLQLLSPRRARSQQLEITTAAVTEPRTGASHSRTRKPRPSAALFRTPSAVIPADERAAALEAIRADIGDCTRCPLAFQGRHKIVFADGDPNARLMFVGEGPGADEDAQGLPFVGRAGQLLNNMINAMGLKRERGLHRQHRQMPSAAKPHARAGRSQYLHAVSLAADRRRAARNHRRPRRNRRNLSARRQVFARQPARPHPPGLRESKLIVTYHPAYLAARPAPERKRSWKDSAIAMKELGLKSAESHADADLLMTASAIARSTLQPLVPCTLYQCPPSAMSPCPSRSTAPSPMPSRRQRQPSAHASSSLFAMKN